MDFDFIYQKLVVGTHHDYFAGIPSPHKTLGYLALAHFLIRYGLFLFTGSMQFTKSNSDLLWISGHLALSVSSFLFPIRKSRNFSNQIIWRELQLHNIVFTARSCAIILTNIYCPNASLFSRFCIVMAFHGMADLVTMFFKEGTTMRSMSWDGKLIPVETKPYLDRFYAYSQFGATIVLIVPNELSMEHAFMVMFAVQLSTFLMTLRLKGIINNDMWHLLYTASLLTNYTIGVQHFYSKQLQCANNPDFHIPILQMTFYIWRIFLKKNKYVGWFTIITIYGIYSAVSENMDSFM